MRTVCSVVGNGQSSRLSSRGGGREGDLHRAIGRDRSAAGVGGGEWTGSLERRNDQRAGAAVGDGVVIGGTEQAIGGTSAVAPLYAGCIARINQSLTSGGGNVVGFVNPLLCAQMNTPSVYHDVTQGNNDIYNDLDGEFAAGPGWDSCTGLGSIDGANLLAALKAQSGQAPAPPTPPTPSARKAKA